MTHTTQESSILTISFMTKDMNQDEPNEETYRTQSSVSTLRKTRWHYPPGTALSSNIQSSHWCSTAYVTSMQVTEPPSPGASPLHSPSTAMPTPHLASNIVWWVFLVTLPRPQAPPLSAQRRPKGW